MLANSSLDSFADSARVGASMLICRVKQNPLNGTHTKPTVWCKPSACRLFLAFLSSAQLKPATTCTPHPIQHTHTHTHHIPPHSLRHTPGNLHDDVRVDHQILMRGLASTAVSLLELNQRKSEKGVVVVVDDEVNVW